MNNLEIAFPEKSKEELTIVMKKFYHHFLDIFMEMIKTFSISDKEILERFKLTKQQEMDEFMGRNKNVLLMSSHYANFEWLFSLNLNYPLQNLRIRYKKLSWTGACLNYPSCGGIFGMT